MPQVTSIANQAVFDLPWLVGQQEGLFAQEDLEVVFLPQTSWDAQRPPNRARAGAALLAVYALRSAEAVAFNACEWGQVRRAHASTIGGRIVTLRPAIVSQAIVVRPESPITHVQAMRHTPIADKISCWLALPDAAAAGRAFWSARQLGRACGPGTSAL